MKIKLKRIDEVKRLATSEGEIKLLVQDKIYDVLGIKNKEGQLHFYLDVGIFIPVLFKSLFFEIIDSRVSKYWHFSIVEDRFILTFEDWINIPEFEQYYIEGDVDLNEGFYNLREFSYYKELLINEFRESV